MRKRTAPVTISALVVAPWGRVMPGTQIDQLHIDTTLNPPDIVAYGGEFSKPIPDMVTFDAYLQCSNPADRAIVAQFFS